MLTMEKIITTITKMGFIDNKIIPRFRDSKEKRVRMLTVVVNNGNDGNNET